VVEFGDRSYKKTTLTYSGMNATTHQWSRQSTWGGKLVENLCQFIAREVLVNGMRLATEAGLDIVATVHDEIVCEVPEWSPLGVDDLRECMIAPLSWAEDLPLDAEGYEAVRYRK
jgi:DNA polymerase